MGVPKRMRNGCSAILSMSTSSVRNIVSTTTPFTSARLADLAAPRMGPSHRLFSPRLPTMDLVTPYMPLPVRDLLPHTWSIGVDQLFILRTLPLHRARQA